MTTYNKFDFKIQFPTTIFKVNSRETNQVVKEKQPLNALVIGEKGMEEGGKQHTASSMR